MALLKLFASEKRVNRRINEYLVDKKVLKLRIDTQVLVEMAKIYPNQSLDELKLKYSDKIKKTTQLLYQEFVLEIDRRIIALNRFKNHFYPV